MQRFEGVALRQQHQNAVARPATPPTVCTTCRTACAAVTQLAWHEAAVSMHADAALSMPAHLAFPVLDVVQYGPGQLQAGDVLH